jgi:hypothetical protein
MMDLLLSGTETLGLVGEVRTHVAKDFPSQLLANLESLHSSSVLGDSFLFSVDSLERVREVGGGDG